ncbi:MBL fold metallo-hydrolase [Longispora sp. NPDC051575]|uniref:MBL fold metallo-hydrolase n=1 Tax=Longispora sp. NPDC051575 TaxID=3154943 RepID=UPI00341B4B63
MSGSAGALLEELPAWARLVRAPNPGPMTLTGTNTWVLRDPEAYAGLVVDPGPLDEAHLAAIVAHGPVAMILVTHGHHDHVEGAARLRELTGAPILAVDPAHGAHPVGHEEPDGSAPEELRDGDEVPLTGITVEVLTTPGHTSDSASFLVNGEAVLTGDTILGMGSTIVAHPDGNLGAYLESLARLEALGSIPALPGHGPALADVSAAAGHYLAHRRARLDQVRAALDAGANTPAEVVAVVYSDVDPALWWAAELTVRAQLDYLRVTR